jgi:hypothetical protein
VVTYGSPSDEKPLNPDPYLINFWFAADLRHDGEYASHSLRSGAVTTAGLDLGDLRDLMIDASSATSGQSTAGASRLAVG